MITKCHDHWPGITIDELGGQQCLKAPICIGDLTLYITPINRFVFSKAFFILGAWIVQDYGWWFLHLLLYVPIIVHKYEKLLFVSHILLSFFTLVWWFFLPPQLLFCFDDRASAEQNVKLFVTHPAMLCWFFLMTCSKPSSVSQKEAFPRSDNHSEDVTCYCSKQWANVA